LVHLLQIAVVILRNTRAIEPVLWSHHGADLHGCAQSKDRQAPVPEADAAFEQR
jgi:hypothetical protein